MWHRLEVNSSVRIFLASSSRLASSLPVFSLSLRLSVSRRLSLSLFALFVSRPQKNPRHPSRTSLTVLAFLRTNTAGQYALVLSFPRFHPLLLATTSTLAPTPARTSLYGYFTSETHTHIGPRQCQRPHKTLDSSHTFLPRRCCSSTWTWTWIWPSTQISDPDATSTSERTLTLSHSP